MKNNAVFYISLVWLSIVIIISWLFGRDLSESELLIKWTSTFSFYPTFSIIFILAAWNFFTNCLRKQKIHNQPSWVFYFYWGLFAGLFPLCAYFFYIDWEYLKNIVGQSCLIFKLLFFYLLFIGLGLLIYRKIKKRGFNDNFRFSPNSVGLERDAFQYKNSAKNTAQGLSSLDDYVNIIALHGGSGYGKSSYVRMIIESLEKGRFLYSYISLTETNESNSFSNLFAERWNETLSARYPKLFVAEYFSLMRLIFRETKQNILFEIMNFLSKFNAGLIKTKSKSWDKHIEYKGNFVSSEIAKLFANIVEYKEDFWIIVIDELERSPIIESYRVVEMLERFKFEGRHGLPIKIIFLLCIGDDFNELIRVGENLELRHLTSKFMIDDPKNITRRLSVPPISEALKKDFLFSLISKFKEKNGIKGAPEEREDLEWGYFDSIDRGPISEEDSVKFTADILNDESPRLINACLLEVELFYSSFRNAEGIEKKDAIRFSDILLISYIKIRYGSLITFFIKTCPKLHSTSEGDLSAKEMLEQMRQKNEDDQNIRTEEKLMNWVANIIGVPKEDIDEWKKRNTLMPSLIASICHSYVDRIKNLPEPESGTVYDGTLSDPARLWDYLALVSDSVKDTKKELVNMYFNHQKAKLNLNDTSNEMLVAYSRFLRDIKKSAVNLNLDVAAELSKRIVNNSMPLIPSNVERDTIRNDALYQFCFQLVEVLENQRIEENSILNQEAENAINLFINFLTSDSLDTGSKFVVLSSFVNSERGASSDIHFRLQRAFEVMKHFKYSEILVAIQHVFSEADKRYFSGKEILYEKEDNFFYVLYQFWSGKTNHTDELKQIREAAARGLKDSLQAIKLYWSRFPAPQNARNYDEAIEDDHFFGNETREFNITLTKLIEISEQRPSSDFNDEEQRKISLWKTIINDTNDAKKYYERCAVKDTKETLKSFLIRSNYLREGDSPQTESTT